MDPDTMSTPKAFISYSWDSEEHKAWVRDLAARLRLEGVDVTLDRWQLAHGDQLPRFMETSVRENDYVLIILTPNYKRKSDNRQGGVGYEGDIMTGEVFAGQNPRKFIPVLRSGTWKDASPSWLGGKYGVNLSGDPYPEDQYHDLLDTLHGTREQAPPIGKRPERLAALRANPAKSVPKLPKEAIELISEAAKDDGRIMVVWTTAGYHVQVGGRVVNEPKNPQSEGLYRAILHKLQAEGLVEKASDHFYHITYEGYELAKDRAES